MGIYKLKHFREDYFKAMNYYSKLIKKETEKLNKLVKKNDNRFNKIVNKVNLLDNLWVNYEAAEIMMYNDVNKHLEIIRKNYFK